MSQHDKVGEAVADMHEALRIIERLKNIISATPREAYKDWVLGPEIPYDIVRVAEAFIAKPRDVFALSAERDTLTDGWCQACKGSGTVKGMTSGHGPDDYEVDVECPECKGTGAGKAPASAIGASEREAILLGVIELVRHHPDFDNGGPMADAMDQAMRGETPTILGDLAHLRRGLRPPRPAKPYEVRACRTPSACSFGRCDCPEVNPK